jgi:acetylornithine deacetylase/succinyl-diaminopimelate desuccinylase-like protein
VHSRRFGLCIAVGALDTADVILMGFGLDRDAIHSPNESFGLDRFHEGIQAIIRFHDHYAEREA